MATNKDSTKRLPKGCAAQGVSKSGFKEWLSCGFVTKLNNVHI